VFSMKWEPKFSNTMQLSSFSKSLIPDFSTGKICVGIVNGYFMTPCKVNHCEYSGMTKQFAVLLLYDES
jgi:hypothetical protein